MSTSNTITKTDLKNVLNNLSLKQASIPVGHKNLLWTNSDLSTNFGATTLTLDLSGYDEVEVVWTNSVGMTTTIGGSMKIPVGFSAVLTQVGGTSGWNSGFITIVTRLCTVNANSVVFSRAFLGYDGQAIAEGYDHNMIPYKIYGIKYADANMSLESLGIHVSTREPTSADGDDGDIWFVYE